jgi:hypothetical protein
MTKLVTGLNRRFSQPWLYMIGKDGGGGFNAEGWYTVPTFFFVALTRNFNTRG